jgi:hypothetical protein
MEKSQGKSDVRLVVAESLKGITQLLETGHIAKEKRHADRLSLEREKIQAKKSQGCGQND